MLTVPEKRPLALEFIEHLEILFIAALRRTYREFHSVDHKRQSAARVLRTLHLAGNDFDGGFFPSRALPANRFRGHLDEINQTGPVQFRRQRRDIGEADSEWLNKLRWQSWRPFA